MRTLGTSLLLPLAACAVALGTETPSSGELLEDCVVPPPAEISRWGAPVPIDVAGRALWIFEAVTLSDGGEARNVGVRVDAAADACEGGARFVGELLPLTAAEAAPRGDGRRVVLSPRAGVQLADAGYLFFESGLAGPGFFDFESLGTGLCRFDSWQTPCERVRDAAGVEARWAPGALPVSSAFVEDGVVHLLACRSVAALDRPCSHASVAGSDVERPEAYRFDGLSGPSESLPSSTTLVNALGAVSLGYSAFHQRYFVTAADPFEARFSIRFISELAGGNADPPRALFQGVPPAPDQFLAGGHEVSSLSEQDGRLKRFVYATENERSPGLHLATFRFLGRPRP